MSILKIVIKEKPETVFGNVYPGFTQSLEADTTNLTVHEWFKLFERILLVEGFSPSVIMDGACRLAFNEGRSTPEMQKIYQEYDLNEFADQPE